MSKKRKRKDRQQRSQKRKEQAERKQVARRATARPQPAPVKEDHLMNTPQPSLDEWRRLYEAAIALKQVAPWEWML